MNYLHNCLIFSELIGTKLELVIRRFAAVKPAKRYCKSNRYNFSEN